MSFLTKSKSEVGKTRSVNVAECVITPLEAVSKQLEADIVISDK